MEWFELRVQKLRTAGEDRFLGCVVRAAERRVSSSHFDYGETVGARSASESSYAVIDRLQFDASLNRRGAHARLRRTVETSGTGRSAQSSSGDDSAQPDP